MEPKKIALLVGALIVAIATAFLARSMFAGSPAPEAGAAAMPDPNQLPHVLVATKQLPVGTIVGPDSFRYQPWPKELVDGAYYIKATTDLKSLQGTVVRNAITAGQPISVPITLQPGSQTITLSLQAGNFQPSQYGQKDTRTLSFAVNAINLQSSE